MEENYQLHGIIRTVTFSGFIIFLCIVLSICSSELLEKRCRNAMDESYHITIELNELLQCMYRYQNIMSDYFYEVNENEDYMQELEYENLKIKEKLSDVMIMIKDIDSEHLSESYLELNNNILDFIDLNLQELSISVLSNKFKSCISQYGIVAMYLSEYSNSCKESSIIAERVISILNFIIAATVLISVYISYHYVSKYGEELQMLKVKADEANRAKSAFLANMSHEIRTPINAVLTMDEMILRENKDKTIHEYAMDIKTAGNTLLSLINDILDSSKIESGKMELIEDNYQLASVINDIFVLISGKAKAKGLKFIIKMTPDIPYGLYGDSLRIRQILLNLLNNAVKYTKEGSITFKISMKPSIDMGMICLVFKVKDTGTGIKAEDMNRLFSKFERIDEKNNRDIEGTGLGMSITKQLVDLMNGDIGVESVYGRGTEFIVTLPQKVTDSTPIVQRDIVLNTHNMDPAPKFTAPDARILLVDDNAMNRKGISLLLKQTMIKVDMAESGEECLSMCSNNKYDIILLDHRMPGMDGIETLKQLRMTVKDTPVIMLTANALSGAKEEYIRIGFTDFLSKPVVPDELEKMIYKYLPKGKKCSSNVTNDSVKKNDNKYCSSCAEFSLDDAIAKCSTKEIFLEMAAEFVESYDSNKNKMEDAYRQMTDNYRVSVHALKSNARMIGLNLLGAMAEEEERRAANGLWDEIQISHGKLMEQYESSYQYMKNYYKKDVAQALEKNDDYVREQCSILSAAIKNGDLDLIDVIADSLRSYEYPYKKELEEAMIMLDYEKIELLVGKMK